MSNTAIDISGSTQEKWTREQVEQMLADDDFSYQDIALPYGLSTGGYDRSRTAKTIFPDDMTGKTVLDLGSKFGYFCFEALKRGASRVVGLDVDSDSIRKSRMLADCLGVDATFDLFDIEAKRLEEEFDYVLCLNLLHHMKNPLKVLDNLVDITRERLVLEVATLGRHDRRKVGLTPWAAWFENRSPNIFVSRNGTWGKRAVQKFFFTKGAIENLLIFQRAHFARLDMVPSEHKNRFIAMAHRRRIDHLLVVNGPTSAGKKTLIRNIENNAAAEVAAKLGIKDGREWAPHMHANRVWQPSEVERGKMILHYDFLRPHLRSAKVHKRDEALDTLECAKKITFLTIWAPPERLRMQIKEGEIDKKKVLGIYYGRKRHLKIAKEYESTERILEHYRRWFDYTRTKSDDHVIVCISDPITFYTIDEWERMVSAP